MRSYFVHDEIHDKAMNERSEQASMDMETGIDLRHIASELQSLEEIHRYDLQVEARTPSYCAGCPHRGTSSIIMEIRRRFQNPSYMHRVHHIDGTIDILSHGGIGCYSLNFLPPFRDMHNMSAMGLGGAAGMGAYPFTTNKHYVLCGDSTFFHSEMSTLSNAIKDRQDILYIILDNKNTAMTGHQVTAGSAFDIMGYKTIQQDIESVVRGMDTNGHVYIRKINPSHREEYLDLLEGAFLMNGVRVIIADRECGITYHRAKKEQLRETMQQRGFLRTVKHINISEEVCENCRECTRATGCPGLTLVDTPYGEKVAIDQSICVDDTYCTKIKVCPSFEQVMIIRNQKPIPRSGQWNLWMKDVPTPIIPKLSLGTGINCYAIFIAGVGGMGLGFIAKLLTEAGAKEGFTVNFYHQKGLAQRNGAVVSHVLFSLPSSPISQRIPEGKADVILGLDYLETVRGMHYSDAHKTTVICNTAETQTIQMLMGEDSYPQEIDARIRKYSISDQYFGADFFELAEYYFGNRVYANLMMLGTAYQKGLIPLRAENIEEVIRESVRHEEREANLRAFRLGRRFIVDPTLLRTKTTRTDYKDILAEKAEIIRKKRATLAHTFFHRASELIEVMPDLSDDAKKTFALRYYDLLLHDALGYAERFAKRVLEVYYVESQRIKDTGAAATHVPATEAVIWNLSKVMTIKDEIWVAHLLTSEEKLLRDQARYNVDPQRGDRIRYLHFNRPKFTVFGIQFEWNMNTRNWMLRVMKRMKFLRRILRHWHATEKAFRDWYFHDVITAFIEGKFMSHDDALEALQLPSSCTGYREIVYPKYEKAQERFDQLLAKRIRTSTTADFPFEPLSVN